MVKVRDNHPLERDGSIDINTWLKRVTVGERPEAANTLRQVCNFAKKLANNFKTPYGESSFEQGLIIAEILYDLKADLNTIIAGIFYPPVKFGNINQQQLEPHINLESVNIIQILCEVDSFHEKTSIKSFNNKDFLPQTLSNLRKMLLSLSSDVRAILIKLAQHLCDLRYAKHIKENLRIELAKETINIYAPVANRLGIGQLKWELEDLSFRYLEPNVYKNIAEHLAEKRGDREKYINSAITKLTKLLQEHHLEAKIDGRAKHIYSIWLKMQRKKVKYQEIYDVRAIRIVVDKLAQCYAVLGIVHSLWKHIPKEFDDYITRPKSNGYQSLHTAVMGPEGKVFEIQIRTKKMHQVSELGVAAHWSYKGGDIDSRDAKKKLSMLQDALNWQDELVISNDKNNSEDINLSDEKIFVFTPQGDVIDLPNGSTAIDFAYKIHTDVGNKCRGAKADGKIIPLNMALTNGVAITILTAKHGGPSRDWLNPHLKFIKTARSRTKIQQWFKLQDRGQNINDGKELFFRELKRLGFGTVKHSDLQVILSNFPSLKTENDLYASIAVGELRIPQILSILQKLLTKGSSHPVKAKSYARTSRQKGKSNKSLSIDIGGAGNLPHHLARCCKPYVGDNIIGYTTIGGGVSIHKAECLNILENKEKKENRFIEVFWQSNDKDSSVVSISIKAFQRRGLLKDITDALATDVVDMHSIKSSNKPKDNLVIFYIDLEIPDLPMLQTIFTKIQRIRNIIDVCHVNQ